MGTIPGQGRRGNGLVTLNRRESSCDGEPLAVGHGPAVGDFVEVHDLAGEKVEAFRGKRAAISSASKKWMRFPLGSTRCSARDAAPRR